MPEAATNMVRHVLAVSPWHTRECVVWGWFFDRAATLRRQRLGYRRFVVLSAIIFGLQHATVMFSDDYSLKRRSLELAVIAAVVGAIVVLVELLW